MNKKQAYKDELLIKSDYNGYKRLQPFVIGNGQYEWSYLKGDEISCFWIEK